MAEPAYMPGEQVRIVSARHRVGVIGAPERRQGQFWYPVFFGQSQTEIVPEEDLEGMCCNFPKAARERLVESAWLRLMPPPRTSC